MRTSLLQETSEVQGPAGISSNGNLSLDESAATSIDLTGREKSSATDGALINVPAIASNDACSEGLGDPMNHRDHIHPTGRQRSDSTELLLDSSKDDAAPLSQCQDINCIEHEVHNGIILFNPTIDQWHDFPSLLQYARSLGADKSGIFKVRLPEEVRPSLSSFPLNMEGHKAICFSSQPQINGTFMIEAEEIDVVPAEDLELCEPCTAALSTDEHVSRYERLLQDEEALRNIYYYVDIDARNVTSRTRLGLPRESPIWPLKGDRLRDTKAHVPGIHSPYAYQSSNSFGAGFAKHMEDYFAISVSYLYIGEKIWCAIAPNDTSRLETMLKATNPSGYESNCSQFLRHAATITPRAVLDSWEISYKIVCQRQYEVVVTLPQVYHQGFSAGFTIAEAANYADKNWNFEGYRDCQERSCPAGFATRQMMCWREANERQLEIEEFDSECCDDEDSSSGETGDSTKVRSLNRRDQGSTKPKPRKEASMPALGAKRKRNSRSHDRAESTKEAIPHHPVLATVLASVAQLGRIPKHIIQPKVLYTSWTKDKNVDVKHSPLLTRLFFSIASPAAFADLRDACFVARQKGETRRPQSTNTVSETIQALDKLDSTSFADTIERRYHYVQLVTKRNELEDHYKNQEPRQKTRRSLKLLDNTAITDGVAKSYEGFGRASSLALADLMAEAYPDLTPPLRHRTATGTQYERRYRSLKSRLGAGRNWHLMKERFSSGILPLVPVGEEYEIQNYEYVLLDRLRLPANTT